jgi:hypothetical protein
MWWRPPIILFRVEALVAVPLHAEKLNMLPGLGALFVLGTGRSGSPIRLTHLQDTQIGWDSTVSIRSQVRHRVFSKTWHKPHRALPKTLGANINPTNKSGDHSQQVFSTLVGNTASH